MQWTDKGIIISSRKFSEKSVIIGALTENNGLHFGVVKNAYTKTSKGIFQQGNIVELTWKARLSEHMGSFSCELLESSTWYLIDQPKKLAAALSICNVIEKCLAEREPHREIFQYFCSFLESLKQDFLWEQAYIFLEIEMLSRLGFGLDFDSCAVTGQTDNLAYISPKTGRAVTEEGAGLYKDKLLKLPKFIATYGNSSYSEQEIIDGMKLTGYFLSKNILIHKNIKSLPNRDRFFDMLCGELKETVNNG